MTKRTISLEQFEEISNLLILLSFFDEIGNDDLGSLSKEFSNKFFDILISYFIRYAEHFEASANTTMNKKLKFDYLQPFHLIKIEDIE